MFDQQVTQIPGVLVGRVTGVDARGRPQLLNDAGESLVAEVVWMKEAHDWADCIGLRVVFACVDGDETRPLVLGLLDEPPTPPEGAPETLRVESRRELVIQCGKSKIALRADGRIEIRGGHLISRSSGPNKIKGGTVHIN